MSDKIYSWEFDDKKNRGSMWYMIALSIVLGLSIWGVFTNQYGMTFIILLIAGLFYFVENNSEDNVRIEINNNGIIIAGTFYDFKSISSFGIVYKKAKAVLLRLNLNKRGLRNIDVQINNSNLSEIKDILGEYLEETPKIELTITEKIIKFLKL